MLLSLAFLCLQISVAYRRRSFLFATATFLLSKMFRGVQAQQLQFVFVACLFPLSLQHLVCVVVVVVVVDVKCRCFAFVLMPSFDINVVVFTINVGSIVDSQCRCRFNRCLCRCSMSMSLSLSLSCHCRCSMHFAQLCLIICCCIRLVCSQIMEPQLRGCGTAAQSLLCNMGHPCCPTRGQSMLSLVVSFLREPVC